MRRRIAITVGVLWSVLWAGLITWVLWLAQPWRAPWAVALTGGSVWLVGLAGLLVAFDQLRRRDQAQLEMLAALQQSEERFRAIADYTADLEIWFGTDGRVRWVNPSVQRILGYAPAECQAMTDFPVALASPEDRDGLRAMAGASGAGEEHDRIVRMRHRDGGYRWLSVSWQPARTAAGQPMGVRASLRDVTLRVKAESAQREAEANFRLIVQTSRDGVWVLDREQRTSYVNARMAQLLGLAETEILGRPFEDFLFAEDLPVHRARMEQRRAGQTGDYELRFRRPDGRELWALVAATARRTAQGEFDGSFAMFTDITQRQEAEQAERASAANLRALVEAATQSILLIEVDGTVLAMNEIAARRLGRTRDELLGSDICGALPPEVVADRRARVAEVVATGRPVRFEDLRAGRLLDQTLAPVCDDTGRVVRVAIFAEDITEYRRADAIMQARVRLIEHAATHSLEELLIATLDEAEILTGSSVGFYHFLQPDQQTLALQAWSTRTTREFCRAEGKGRHYDLREAGVWVDCVRQRRALIHNDYAALPHRKGLPPGHAPVIRELVVPVFRGSLIVAILGVGNKMTDYDETDIATVSRLADIAWDITERVRIQMALRQSEARFRQMVEHASEVFYRQDIATGRLEYVSPKIRELLGYTSDEMMAMDAAAQSAAIHPEDLPNLRQFTTELAEADARGEAFIEREFRLRSKAGDYRWIQGSYSLVQEVRGESRLVVGAIRDVTARRQAAEALRRHHEELVQFNEAMVGRELRMIELKAEVNELCRARQEPPRYTIEGGAAGESVAGKDSA